MKILYFANPRSIHTQRWVQYFASKGHRVAYWGSDWHKEWQSLPDIIHAHYAGRDALKAALLSRRTPFVLTVWGSDIVVNSDIWWKRPILKWILDRADLITTDASHMASRMIKLGVPKRKIWRINFGVDTDKFRPGLAAEWFTPTVVALRDYNIETWNKATVIVQATMPKYCRLHLVRTVPQDVLPGLLNSAWVYIDTSPTDGGLAQSTAEAMACGLPVVITRFGDNPLWVGHDQLFRVGDHEVLAKRVCDFLEDGYAREQRGAANRDMIVTCNNYQTEMAKMEKVYYEVLSKRRPR